MAAVSASISSTAALSLPKPSAFTTPTTRLVSWKQTNNNKGPYWAGRCINSRNRGFSGARMSLIDSDLSIPVLKKAGEVSGPMLGTSIFLLGVNGSMKAAIGKILAKSLNYHYFDSDDVLVEALGGISKVRLLLENDIQGLLDTETEVLKELSSWGALVISAGDGAVRNSTNLSYVRYGISVWVDIPLSILVEEKQKNGDEYPFLKASTPVKTYAEMSDALTRCYKEAKEGYATADARVTLAGVAAQHGYDLGNVTPTDMALEVLTQIEKLMRKKQMMDEAGKPF